MSTNVSKEAKEQGSACAHYKSVLTALLNSNSRCFTSDPKKAWTFEGERSLAASQIADCLRLGLAYKIAKSACTEERREKTGAELAAEGSAKTGGISK